MEKSRVFVLVIWTESWPARCGKELGIWGKLCEMMVQTLQLFGQGDVELEIYDNKIHAPAAIYHLLNQTFCSSFQHKSQLSQFSTKTWAPVFDQKALWFVNHGFYGLLFPMFFQLRSVTCFAKKICRCWVLPRKALAIAPAQHAVLLLIGVRPGQPQGQITSKHKGKGGKGAIICVRKNTTNEQ